MDYPVQSEGYKHSSITLCSEDLPEVKNWMTGGEYVVILHVKEMSSHVEGKDNVEGHFQVVSAKVASSRYTKSIMEAAKNG